MKMIHPNAARCGWTVFAMNDPMNERMAELESRLAFQEDLIENLNHVVARQDREILSLKQRLAELTDRLRELHDSAIAGVSPAVVEVPPHY